MTKNLVSEHLPQPPSSSDTSITPGFYSLDLEARRQLVEKSIADKASLTFRWNNLATENSDAWSRRAQRAVQPLGDVSSIVDIGCGMMTLERYISPSTTYLPVDIVRRDQRTCVVDLNKEPLPDIPAECAVALGLIEYLFDVEKWLRSLFRLYPTAVASYNPVDTVPDREVRLGHAWVNHFGVAEMESMFEASGYHVAHREPLDATQFIWLLRRPPHR